MSKQLDHLVSEGVHMKSRMNHFMLLFCFFSVAFGHDSHNKGDIEDYTKLKYKVAIATRTEDPPAIDGRIDDAAWEKAILADEFLQYDPYNLEAPTVRTEFRILYDDEYLYIAFDNFDPNPEKIMARMARRDDWEEGFEFNSDWVGFGIDSRNDDKTGYWFAVNAAEVQVDVAISGDGYDGFDGTWNAVWD